MSKHTLSSRRISRPVFDQLEDRRLMTVGPATIVDGSVNDIVYNENAEQLHVVYYNSAAKTLNHQAFNNDGTSSANTVIDTGDAGQYLSIAQDDNGIIHAAYYDAINGDLKYARRDLGGTWSTSVIDSNNTVGLYPSIAIGADGKPAIAYYKKTGGNLRFAKFNGTSWDISLVAFNNDVGRQASLALNEATGKFGIGFNDDSAGQVKYAEESGASWVVQTADASTTLGGAYISLNFNGGLPQMSYYDSHNADLKFAARSSRGKWNAETVASKNSQGLHTDLEYTFDTNQPAIVYYNKTADAVMLATRNVNGTWSFETEVSGGGRNVSAADAPSDGQIVPELFLVYTDGNTLDLNVATI